ncbi:formin-binding protein [Coemansia sp. RSA 1933]|nr:formin-binding protein [Coemansia sp. RSA 1933]
MTDLAKADDPAAIVVVGSDDGTASESDGGASQHSAKDDDLLAGFSTDETAIELMHSRLRTLADLDFSRFTALKYLGCRQNLISDTVPLAAVASSLKELRELDMYDNRLKRIDQGVGALAQLENLDLSFNKIRTIENIDALVNLHNLFFVSNKIQTIENLSRLTMLRNLELGANRIRAIQNLDALVNLEELYLGKNKIARLENLGSLRRLRILSIQSNRITRIEGLEQLENLEELYLSHNGIERIENLESNTRLTILDVTKNHIKKLSGIAHLQQLEDLWASGNDLASFENIETTCGPLKALRTIYLEFNPLQRDQPAHYRRKLKLALPQITQIDATMCRFVFNKLGGGNKDQQQQQQSSGDTADAGTIKSTTTAPEMHADFVCGKRFADNFWSADERCISVLMHKLKNAKQTCSDILQMVQARAQMEEELGKKLAKQARAGLGCEEVGSIKDALRTIRAELEANAKSHLELARQLRAEIEKPLATFISDQRTKRRAQTTIIQKTEGDRNALRSQVRKLQDKRRADTKKVGDLDLQVNGLQGGVDPKLRGKLDRAQMQQKATENEFVDVRMRLREADHQWRNVWRAACDVFQVLEEERIEYLKTSLWTYTNLVSSTCVSDDESMESIRQDLEKISVADDIAVFIETFGTGPPKDSSAADKPADKAVDKSVDSKPSSSTMTSNTAASHQSRASAIPTPAQAPPPQAQIQPDLQAYANRSATPQPQLQPDLHAYANRSATPQPDLQAYSNRCATPQAMHGLYQPQQPAMNPQHQNQQQQRPVSMHAPQQQNQHLFGWGAGATNRPASSMQGTVASEQDLYRRSSNNDMYAYAMDPRAPSSMSSTMYTRAESPAPIPQQQQQQQQQMPPRMGSPHSRASTYNSISAGTATGNFGTLTGSAQMQAFGGVQQQQQHGSNSAPGSPMHMDRPMSSAMYHPHRSVTPVQQQQQQPSPQQQQYMMNRPPTQMSHSPVMHAGIAQPMQRAPSAMANGYPIHQPQLQQQQQQQPQQPQQLSQKSQVSETGKEILFYVKVLYDYDAENDKELSIREGDVISVLAVSADGWWEGERTDRNTGRSVQGIFPSNFSDPIANFISGQ